MLVVAVMHLHHVVEGRVEEGKLSKHHCGAERDMVWRSQGGRRGGCAQGWGKPWWAGGCGPGAGPPQWSLLVHGG